MPAAYLTICYDGKLSCFYRRHFRLLVFQHRQACSPREQSDMRVSASIEAPNSQPRISRSLSSGAHSRDPLAYPGYASSTRQFATDRLVKLSQLICEERG